MLRVEVWNWGWWPVRLVRHHAHVQREWCVCERQRQTLCAWLFGVSFQSVSLCHTSVFLEGVTLGECVCTACLCVSLCICLYVPI